MGDGVVFVFWQNVPGDGQNFGTGVGWGAAVEGRLQKLYVVGAITGHIKVFGTDIQKLPQMPCSYPFIGLGAHDLQHMGRGILQEELS